MFFVVHVDYGVITEIYHDQSTLSIVHIDYDIVFEVCHDYTMVFAVYKA